MDILSLALLAVLGVIGVIALIAVASMVFAAPAVLAGKFAEMIARKFLK